MGQGVLEGEFALGEQPRLVEELGSLQVYKATVQVRLRHLGNSLQQGQGHLGADDRRGLEHVFLLGRQPVDTGCQHGLHRGGHLNVLEGLEEAIGTRRTDKHPGLDQGAYALLQKKRIASGTCNQERLEGHQAGVGA